MQKRLKGLMKYQKLYNLIFSDKRSVRWKRHFLFWLAVFFYHLLRIGIMMPGINSGNLFFLFELIIFWGVMINMMLTYSIVYFVVPRYFDKKRYGLFVVGVVVAFLSVQLIGLFHSTVITNTPVSNAIGVGRYVSIWRAGFIRLFGNPPLICCLFLSLKTLKNWYVEQQKTETLEMENANAEIQLLKAQVHPHFLFNTLNNIYSFSLTASPQAGVLIAKLAAMLKYMVHECEEKTVSLAKELKLMQDYMGLERVRYGKRLDMKVEITGDPGNKQIAPLLMIPFVENSFKHGTSQMLQHPWVKLEITIIDNQLFFKLVNSRPLLTQSSLGGSGIGLMNVRKRLQLLYPGRHQLDIRATGDEFAVYMQVMLEERVEEKVKPVEITNEKIVVYAG
jgi:sensor histidine kinase YesM